MTSIENGEQNFFILEMGLHRSHLSGLSGEWGSTPINRRLWTSFTVRIFFSSLTCSTLVLIVLLVSFFLSFFLAVEILGLFRDDVEMFYKTIGADGRKIFDHEWTEMKCVGTTRLPRWKDRAMWSGDEWLLAFAVSDFAFSKACQERADLQVRLKCFRTHQAYLRILLQESITQEEIDKAQGLCILWRKMMVAWYGEKEMSYPNFHAILRKCRCTLFPSSTRLPDIHLFLVS